ncbi:Ribonuclease H domain [Arabidopsis thaliana x Arabidopsis arenosa]|uniref:Ribonuclease H domain n=1 Tax=Arabidopsis thaliana x Arabidopsis arenosa TaxID=1240361 RepID=A0A8T2C6F7_9BRAS|nr:Ribonuclease H domain [Arabidopsis thaliana x Arabidopsis arenosa]
MRISSSGNLAVDRWTNRNLPTFLSQISFWVKIVYIPKDFRTDLVIREAACVLGHIDETKILEATGDTEGEVWAHVKMNVSARLIFVRSIEFEPGTLSVNQAIRREIEPMQGVNQEEDEAMNEQSESSIPIIGTLRPMNPPILRQTDSMSITLDAQPIAIREIGGTSRVPQRRKRLDVQVESDSVHAINEEAENSTQAQPNLPAEVVGQTDQMLREEWKKLVIEQIQVIRENVVVFWKKIKLQPLSKELKEKKCLSRRLQPLFHLTHPQSLLVRLYKAKYYPKSSLLEAGTKWRSSHAWKSILQDNLKKRKLRIDNTCQICGECLETANHLLFQCKLSKEIWELAPISAPPDGSWTFSTQKAGIGWTMYDKRAHLIVKGFAAVNPSASPLEVEIEALRMAIMKIKNLGYIHVTFSGALQPFMNLLRKKHLYLIPAGGLTQRYLFI